MANKDILSRFTKSLNVSERGVIANKGGTNLVRLKPVIAMENAVSATTTLGSIPAGGNTDVGQVFKGQLSDLDSCCFRLGVTATTIRTEDFESYADTAALRLAWVPSDVINSPNSLETVVISEGAKSMAMTITKNKSLLDTFTLTFAAEDWTSVSDLSFQVRQTSPIIDNQVHIRVGDGINSKSAPVSVSSTDVFEQRVINLETFVEDGAGITDLAAITTIEFEVVVDNQNGTIYVDDIEILTAPGTADVEIRNVSGASPTTLGSVVKTVSFDLVNSADFLYIIELNATLVPDQHYSINIRNLSAGTTVLDVIGAIGEYTQGEGYTSDDNGATLTFPGGDIFFVLFFRTLGVIGDVFIDFDRPPGDGRVDIAIINSTSNKIKRYLVHRFELLANISHEFMGLEEEPVQPDDEVVLILVDDATSLASEVVLSADFRHEPVNVVG